jgi:hypothetical protein
MNVQTLWQQCLQAHLQAAGTPAVPSSTTLARVVAAAMETSQQRRNCQVTADVHAAAAKSTSPPGARLASMLLDYARDDGERLRINAITMRVQQHRSAVAAETRVESLPATSPDMAASRRRRNADARAQTSVHGN